jgi:hypothetical protein
MESRVNGLFSVWGSIQTLNKILNKILKKERKNKYDKHT